MPGIAREIQTKGQQFLVLDKGQTGDVTNCILAEIHMVLHGAGPFNFDDRAGMLRIVSYSDKNTKKGVLQHKLRPWRNVLKKPS